MTAPTFSWLYGTTLAPVKAICPKCSLPQGAGLIDFHEMRVCERCFLQLIRGQLK